VKTLRIGSRGSVLALTQSNWVKQRIEAQYRELTVELTIIKTSGDRFTELAIPAIGGKGVFTKEIEEALLRREIDLAVHSMKDLPTELPPGLALVAVPAREDARDALVSRDGCKLSDLPKGAKLATGSLRRQAQLMRFRGDLQFVAMRGNVDTRLRKLDDGEADGLIMAAAGLKRIGRAERITEYLNDEVCLSAVAQGALGIEGRDDGELRQLLAFLHDGDSAAETRAERAMLRRLSGGCHVPIGARARVKGEGLQLMGVVASIENKSICRASISGNKAQAEDLGYHLAEQLIGAGADNILAPN
jgi:hydroxymethylbilane synthase